MIIDFHALIVNKSLTTCLVAAVFFEQNRLGVRPFHWALLFCVGFVWSCLRINTVEQDNSQFKTFFPIKIRAGQYVGIYHTGAISGLYKDAYRLIEIMQ